MTDHPDDEWVEFINRRLPMGSGELLVAELVARGLRGFVESSVDVPSIIRSVRVPTFEGRPACLSRASGWYIAASGYCRGTMAGYGRK
jgi:hypothetical protein